MKYITVFLLLGGVLAAQPRFEVATIKPAEPGNLKGYRGGCRGIDTKTAGDAADIPLGRCVVSDARLSHMITMAWSLKTISMIQNAPDWVIGTDERYNLQAKAEDQKATEAQLLEMLRALLVERFHLKYHREDREEGGYALVVAKGGPKMEKSSDTDVATLGPFNKANPTITISPRKASMASLAQFLSTFGPGQVKDETGLDGLYNFHLTWNETEGPSVFSAIQTIGLRLESRKVPVSYFVIESAQRPGAN
jgi:uncharacterized protein (TIGR03435 family)